MVAVAANSQAPSGPWRSTGRPERIPWRRRWPAWTPFAAAVWGVLYAAVQLAWAATGTTVMYPWGQVFPRWTPLLAGRRVPRLLPLIPAWLTAATLSVYGVALTVVAPLSAIGVLPRFKPSAPFTTGSGLTWMVEFGGLAFAGLGIGLVVAARSYAARSRPVCLGASSTGE